MDAGQVRVLTMCPRRCRACGEETSPAPIKAWETTRGVAVTGDKSALMGVCADARGDS